MAVDENRRPISQRSRGWAKWLAATLVKANIAPNVISFTSIVWASLAGLCFYGMSIAANAGDRMLLCLGAALFCQLRLLANMMDGMVAVEAGKASKDGMVWNELPDRFADIAVLVGAGYAVAQWGVADASLGWAAAVAAVMTAYVREVGHAAGAPADFSGPMAKPHRMFVMTMAALLSIVDARMGPTINFLLTGVRGVGGEGAFVALGLWIVVVGAAFTTLNRARHALVFLNKS